MTGWFISGLAIGLAVLLAVAATLKLRNLGAFEAVLVRLLPKRAWRIMNSRTGARLIVGGEILASLALVTPNRTAFLAGAAAATLFSVCFLASILRAVRKETSCGCFGIVTRAAGYPEIFRGVFLLAISTVLAVLGAVSASGHAFTSLRFEAVAIAFAVISVAVIPGIMADRLSARLRGHEPTEELRADEAAMSRRTLLARSVAAGLALASAAALGPASVAQANPPPPPRSCEAQFDLCYGCTTKITWENDVACCSHCYAQCQLGPPCIPGVHCGGCWPGP